MRNAFAFGVGPSKLIFINVVSVGYGQIKRLEGLRVSIRVSLVIRQKFHLIYARCSERGRLAAS